MTTAIQPTLWDQPRVRRAARRQTAGSSRAHAHEAFRATVERVALRLALDVGELGFISEDVRTLCEREGIEPPGTDPQRRWSVIGRVLESLATQGKLVDTGRDRRTRRPESKGNKTRVYVLRRNQGEPR